MPAGYRAPGMAGRRSTVIENTPQVVVIGHNPRVRPTVAVLIGGHTTVRVYTGDQQLEEQLVVYPGVSVGRLRPDYAEPPPDLPEGPFFLCVDRKDDLARIRSWLPPTFAVFHLTNERRGKVAQGLLSLGPSTQQLWGLLQRQMQTLRRVDRLAAMARNARHPLILMYGDPDPDAIGSALALASIWRHAGVNPIVRYTGEIQRYQNWLLVQYLKEPLAILNPVELEAADLVAVVDAQPGFWREAPPRCQVIIDHHPRREDTAAPFCDIREKCGATSSILTEYLAAANLPISRRLATALLYGLLTDTADLQRNTYPIDVKAFDRLHPRAEHNVLRRVSRSRVPMTMLDDVAWGMAHRLVFRDIALIHFGTIANPDLLVQTADLMMFTCGLNWVVCAGVLHRKLIVILRGDGHHQDVGRRARLAFEKLGSAGGHKTMGRAEVPLPEDMTPAGSIDLLVHNLFRRMSERRRSDFIKTLLLGLAERSGIHP